MIRFLFLAGRDIKHPKAGGGDIQAWEWARYATHKGHSVTFICSKHPTLAPEEELDSIRVLRLGSGILLPLHSLLFYRRHEQEFDLVYEDVIGGSRPPFLSPLYVRKPIIVAWHQVSRVLLSDSYYAPVAFLLSCAEKAIAKMYMNINIRAPSEERRQELHRELGLPLERIHVIPASIPEDWLTEGSVETTRDCSVLYLGNIRPYKGIHTLVEAFPQVRREYEQARLVIAGRAIDRRYEKNLRNLVARLGLTDCVQFRLDITEEVKRTLLYKSSVLVLPSRLEGFGIVVLEANACGVPVVASSGVPEEAVKHGYNGLRYAFEDTNTLARNLIRLFRDKELHNRLSANGRVFANQFAWGKIGAQFENLAASLIVQ